MNELALQYYLKAKDYYPYSLDECIESLNYALSYDDEQPEIYCLYGQFYAEQMKNYDKARYFYEQAINADPLYLETYYLFCRILIEIGEFDKANKMLLFVNARKGANKSSILQLKALKNERKCNYPKAISRLKEAIKLSIDDDEISELKKQLSRVEEKKKNR